MYKYILVTFRKFFKYKIYLLNLCYNCFPLFIHSKLSKIAEEKYLKLFLISSNLKNIIFLFLYEFLTLKFKKTLHISEITYFLKI
jgi:hypothetical protein